MPAKQESIAWAAAAAIAELGLDGASLREVAARTGASLGIVTYHFKNRDELLAITMETVAEAMRERAEEARSADPVEAELSSALPLTADSRIECAVWLAFAEAAARDARHAVRFQQYYAEWQAAVAAGVRATTGQGAADARHTAALLTAATDGIALQAMASGMAPSRQRRMLREAIDRLCGG